MPPFIKFWLPLLMSQHVSLVILSFGRGFYLLFMLIPIWAFYTLKGDYVFRAFSKHASNWYEIVIGILFHLFGLEFSRLNLSQTRSMHKRRVSILRFTLYNFSMSAIVFPSQNTFLPFGLLVVISSVGKLQRSLRRRRGFADYCFRRIINAFFFCYFDIFDLEFQVCIAFIFLSRHASQQLLDVRVAAEDMMQEAEIILDWVVLGLENYSLVDAAIAGRLGVAMLLSLTVVIKQFGLG